MKREPDTAMHNAETPSVRQPVETGSRVLPSGIIPTACLFQGTQEIQISHNGENYRLRITRNDKLILTK